jgi:hypothetical protein
MKEMDLVIDDMCVVHTSSSIVADEIQIGDTGLNGFESRKCREKTIEGRTKKEELRTSLNVEYCPLVLQGNFQSFMSDRPACSGSHKAISNHVKIGAELLLVLLLVHASGDYTPIQSFGNSSPSENN